MPRNFNFITRLSQDLIHKLEGFSENFERQVPNAKIVSLALDLLKPHIQALGLRVAKLSRTHVEIILPSKYRNLTAKGFVLEGAVVMAACEALRWLWLQNKPEGSFSHEFGRIQFESVKPLSGQLRLRAELTELARETALLELSKMQKSELTVMVLVFDHDEQLVAQVELESRLRLTPALEWT